MGKREGEGARAPSGVAVAAVGWLFGCVVVVCDVVCGCEETRLPSISSPPYVYIQSYQLTTHLVRALVPAEQGQGQGQKQAGR
jgi:hypothetical protein